MISDDAYRAKLQQTIAEIRAWKGFIADVARYEEYETDSAWGVALTPRTPGACPIELVLRNDQRFDITIGGETYEDVAIASLDLFLPMIQAVAEGRVITRFAASAATGLLRDVSTLVTLADGSVFTKCRANPDAAFLPEPHLETRDTSYLPYRR